MAFAILVHCIYIGCPKSYRCIRYTNIFYLLHCFFSSPAARQITLNPPKKTSTGDHNEDGLCVLIFEPLIGSDYSVSYFRPFIDDSEKKFILLFPFISWSFFQEIEFIKPGSFSLKELEALISALKIASEKGSSGKNTPRKGNDQRSKHLPSLEKVVSDLEAMGVRVYGFDETSSVPMDGTVIWENLAGYEPQKRHVPPVCYSFPFLNQLFNVPLG